MEGKPEMSGGFSAEEQEDRLKFKMLLEMQMEILEDMAARFATADESEEHELAAVGVVEFYNKYHDPETGRFTNAGGASGADAGSGTAGKVGSELSPGDAVYKTLRGGFSWKTLLGITSLRNKIAKKTGIPTTKAGIKRKISRGIAKTVTPKPLERFLG